MGEKEDSVKNSSIAIYHRRMYSSGNLFLSENKLL